jgi:putative PIN family toxin of toxin-antitoxin system
MDKSSLTRIVVDTNIFVASAYNPTSASGRIVDAIERGELQLVVSPAMKREYDRIIPKAVRVRERIDRIREIVDKGDQVEPPENPAVTEDREDDKFPAAALAGDAEIIITSDPHLLDVDGYRGLRILRPIDFVQSSKVG